MIEVIEVRTKKDIREFVNFPLRLYKGNPYFVPPLYGEEIALFKKETIYSEQAESIFFLAKEESKTVGRIQGILQRVSNEKWSQKRVRFTRFDSVDNQAVADALFGAVETWARQKGMDEVVGPLGYSDLEREGLLIEGFDQLSTFEEQYNYPYYQKLIENAGYVKEVDWVESKIFAPDVIDPRIASVSKRMLEKYELRLVREKNAREFVRKWGDGFFDVLDETYEAIYQSVPLSPKMKRNLIDSFKLILNVQFATVIVDKNDKIVGFGLSLPAIGSALQKSGGRLTPTTIVKLLKIIKKPKVVDLALVGVVPAYRNKAISTAIFNRLMEMLTVEGIEYAETNLNLETNAPIRNQWKAFKSVEHKRRRSFVKNIVKE